MTTWDERMPPRPPATPLLEHAATLFRVVGTTKRPLRRALFRVATGLELRLEYEDRPDDVQRSQLFRVQNDDAIAEIANSWHHALRAAGFEDLSVQ